MKSIREVTFEILGGIWDETRKTNERVDVLGTEMQALRGEMRELRIELVESQQLRRAQGRAAAPVV